MAIHGFLFFFVVSRGFFVVSLVSFAVCVFLVFYGYLWLVKIIYCVLALCERRRPEGGPTPPFGSRRRPPRETFIHVRGIENLSIFPIRTSVHPLVCAFVRLVVRRH